MANTKKKRQQWPTALSFYIPSHSLTATFSLIQCSNSHSLLQSFFEIMVGKTIICAAALLALQPAFVFPLADDASAPESHGTLFRREDVVVEPPKGITPVVNEVENLTPQELQELIDSVKGKITKRDDLMIRQADVVAAEPTTDGPFLSYLDGWAKPGEDENCTDFTLNGPFTSIHAAMGSSNTRGIKVTAADGNTTEVTAGTETIVDPGMFTFDNNERISKFSVAKLAGSANTISGFSFETDGGKKYEALTSLITENKAAPTWTDVPVGAGILARIRGTNCKLGVFGSIGFDFLDNLDSISITNMDYEGFTNNIMPSGAGTQMTVGSQIVDNRNSSVQQTITLQTTDAITRQRTVTAQSHWQVGGSVGIEAKVGIPLVSESTVKGEFNWQVQELSVSIQKQTSRQIASPLIVTTVYRRYGELRYDPLRQLPAHVPRRQVLHR